MSVSAGVRVAQNPSMFLHLYQFIVLLVQHPAWCFLFEAPGFSLHTASALFSQLSLMDLSGPGGFIELGKIYGFQPCF